MTSRMPVAPAIDAGAKAEQVKQSTETQKEAQRYGFASTVRAGGKIAFLEQQERVAKRLLGNTK